jgi:endonuclease III
VVVSDQGNAGQHAERGESLRQGQQRLERLEGTPDLIGRSEKIEQVLMEIVPPQEWTLFAHLLIYHGRALCTARKPDCEHCPVNHLCPSAFKV